MRKRPLRLALLLVGGAIVNVAMAWGCALWTPIATQQAPPPSSSHLEDRIAFGYTQQEWVWVATAYGVDADGRTDRDRQSPIWKSFPVAMKAGWPARSLTGALRLNAPKFRGELPIPSYKLPAGWRIDGARDQVPLEPLWSGFAINTVFYAAILWLLFAAPFTLRRMWRIKRGLCPKCAYDLRNRPSNSTACPECGTHRG